MTANPMSFNEWLFITVRDNSAIPEDDIIKRFIRMFEMTRAWPAQVDSLEVLHAWIRVYYASKAYFNTRQVVNEYVGDQLFNHFVSTALASMHELEAHCKSTEFAARVAWDDYNKYITETVNNI